MLAETARHGCSWFAYFKHEHCIGWNLITGYGEVDFESRTVGLELDTADFVNIT